MNNHTIEEWRSVNVEGFEGLYSVSSLGRIRRDKGSAAAKAGCILDGHNSLGYRRIALTGSKSRQKKFLIHRLVALAFLETPSPDQTHVNHKDGNGTNNRVENLEWCTPAENHKHQEGLPSFARGEKAPWAKLKNDDIPKIRQMVSDGMSQVQVAKLFNVSPRLIGFINSRERWAHIK